MGLGNFHENGKPIMENIYKMENLSKQPKDGIVMVSF